MNELGETIESKSVSQISADEQFVFGMNKEATQLAIILKHMEKEELNVNPGVHMNVCCLELTSTD